MADGKFVQHLLKMVGQKWTAKQTWLSQQSFGRHPPHETQVKSNSMKITLRKALKKALYKFRTVFNRHPKSHEMFDVLVWVVRPFQEIFLESTLLELSTSYKIGVLRHSTRTTADGNWKALPDGVEAIEVSSDQLRQFRCKIFITPETSKSSKHFPEATHYVHVPHSPVSLHMIYPEGNFNAFDTIMAVGQHHVEEFLRMRKSEAGVNALVAGYGRMDLLRRQYSEFSVKEGSDEPPSKTIAIAPSWHDGNILEIIGIDFTQILLEKGYRVIFRPHYKIAELKPAFIEKLKSHFSRHKNFKLDIAGQDSSIFVESDLLVSDYSGIALEYAFLRERPVLFIDAPPKVRNSNWEDVKLEPIELFLREKLGRIVPPDVQMLIDETEKLLDQPREYFESIVEARNRYCFNFDAGAGRAIAGHISKMLVNIN